MKTLQNLLLASLMVGIAMPAVSMQNNQTTNWRANLRGITSTGIFAGLFGLGSESVALISTAGYLASTELANDYAYKPAYNAIKSTITNHEIFAKIDKLASSNQPDQAKNTIIEMINNYNEDGRIDEIIHATNWSGDSVLTHILNTMINIGKNHANISHLIEVANKILSDTAKTAVIGVSLETSAKIAKRVAELKENNNNQDVNMHDLEVLVTLCENPNAQNMRNNRGNNRTQLSQLKQSIHRHFTSNNNGTIKIAATTTSLTGYGIATLKDANSNKGWLLKTVGAIAACRIVQALFSGKGDNKATITAIKK